MIYACMCIRMTLDSSQAPQAPADHLLDVAECTFTVDFIWYTLLAMGLNSFCLHDLRNSSCTDSTRCWKNPSWTINFCAHRTEISIKWDQVDENWYPETGVIIIFLIKSHKTVLVVKSRTGKRKKVDHQGFTFISGHHPLAVSPQSVSTNL